MEKLKSFVLTNKYNLLLVFIYIIITVFTMLNHEVWRDEAQVWCLCRDLNFLGILNAAKVEGHPFLWYLLIFPFAKLNFPVFSMQILSWLFVTASVIYFTIKSPFSYLFKTIFIFSAGMLYYLPIVSRNYALIPLFLFILANLYKQRKEKPYLYITFIILLSQTHSLIWGLSSALFILFGIEKFNECYKTKEFSKIVPAAILLVYFVSFPFLYLTVPHDNGVIVSYYTRGDYNFYETIRFFLFHYWNFNDNNFLSFNSHPRILELFFAASLIIILFKFFKLDKKVFFIFVWSGAYIFAILNRIWFGGIYYQKIFIMFLVLAFCMWILKAENKIIKENVLKTFVLLLFFISTMVSFDVIPKDIKYNFSGSKQLAEYIKENLNEEEIFVLVGYPFTFSPISAYLPDKKFYMTEIGTYLSYFSFGLGSEVQYAEFPHNAKYYIVQNDFNLYEDYKFKKIFSTNKENLSGVTQQEVFYVYYKLD